MNFIKNSIIIMTAAALMISCAVRKKIVPTRETLEKRAQEYFSAKVEDDLSKMYRFINPSSRKMISEESFVRQQKRYAGFIVKGFSIKEITFTDPANAMVDVIFTMESGDVSTQFPFVFEDGNWYRNYPTYEIDKKK